MFNETFTILIFPSKDIASASASVFSLSQKHIAISQVALKVERYVHLLGRQCRCDCLGFPLYHTRIENNSWRENLSGNEKKKKRRKIMQYEGK